MSVHAMHQELMQAHVQDEDFSRPPKWQSGKHQVNTHASPIFMRVVDLAKNLKPSSRGELEITDLNRLYLEQGTLTVEVMGRGYAWLDTGTHESLLDASQFIATLENRQGLKVSCPEEIAYRQQWIDATQLERLAQPLTKNGYGRYLLRVLKDNVFQ